MHEGEESAWLPSLSKMSTKVWKLSNDEFFILLFHFSWIVETIVIPNTRIQSLLSINKQQQLSSDNIWIQYTIWAVASPFINSWGGIIYRSTLFRGEKGSTNFKYDPSLSDTVLSWHLWPWCTNCEPCNLPPSTAQHLTLTDLWYSVCGSTWSIFNVVTCKLGAWPSMVHG